MMAARHAYFHAPVGAAADARMKGTRRLAFGLATVLGLARRGFFIPYRHAARVAPPGGDRPYGAAGALFDAAAANLVATMAHIEAVATDLRAIDGPPPQPRWGQDWFPRLDAAVAYALVRACRPRRIVEVGSGHSTRFLARAAADGGTGSRITAIDPAPRADIAGLDVEIIRAPVQQAGEAPFAALDGGDFLVIDSSHVLMPGTDVDFLLNQVLPRLAAGVLVHIHDIFLPDGYPRDWDWRGYNEQQAVAAILAGGGYEILFASHYVSRYRPDLLAGTVIAELPLSPGASESSLWLRKRS